VASLKTIVNVTKRLVEGTTNPLPPLPASPLPGFDLAYEARPTASGGEFTGNIRLVPKRTEAPGIFQELIQTFGSSLSLNPTSVATNIGSQALKAGLSQQSLASNPIVGRVPMGFFDDIFGGSDSTDSVGSGFNAGLTATPFDWGGLLNTGVNLLGNALGGGRSQGVPQTFGASMAAVPAVIGAGGAVVRTAGAALAARLASIGLNRATAWTLLKQQGPTALLALGLTAVEVAQLARSRSRYRRMNMCNGRALRRASRRLEGFHKFYKRTCGLPVHSRRSKKYCK